MNHTAARWCLPILLTLVLASLAAASQSPTLTKAEQRCVATIDKAGAKFGCKVLGALDRCAAQVNAGLSSGPCDMTDPGVSKIRSVGEAAAEKQIRTACAGVDVRNLPGYPLGACPDAVTLDGVIDCLFVRQFSGMQGDFHDGLIQWFFWVFYEATHSKPTTTTTSSTATTTTSTSSTTSTTRM